MVTRLALRDQADSLDGTGLNSKAVVRHAHLPLPPPSLHLGSYSLTEGWQWIFPSFTPTLTHNVLRRTQAIPTPSGEWAVRSEVSEVGHSHCQPGHNG
ncbi:hypothetical protein JZ751_009093 [Albula glossodonta]|uniref:Uncharacterized protein n=1 Tax=Albula glossodonta TaxID=121402 RepID=A0A8T2N205_9TELE|nr:hypothetical protein JZ751_009093 [Albula glossodonta]